jgi:hypothetical protein
VSGLVEQNQAPQRFGIAKAGRIGRAQALLAREEQLLGLPIAADRTQADTKPPLGFGGALVSRTVLVDLNR